MHSVVYPLCACLTLSPACAIAGASDPDVPAVSLSINYDDGGRKGKRHVKKLAEVLKKQGCPVVASDAANGELAELHFVSSPPYEVRATMPDYEFVAQAVVADGKASVSGVVLVKASTGIADLKSLQGERIAFVNEQSWSGYLLPKKLLEKAGVSAERDTEFFTGNHAGAVTMMLHGDTFAAAVAEPLAERWAKANDLSIVEVSESIETGGWWMRSDLSQEFRQPCSDALGQLKKSSMKALPAWIEGFRVVGKP